MKHTVMLYLAPKIQNAVLKSIEGDSTKIFCELEKVTFSAKNDVTEEKFRDIMERSKKAFDEGEEDFWIAAIRYMDNFFKENESSIVVF